MKRTLPVLAAVVALPLAGCITVQAPEREWRPTYPAQHAQPQAPTAGAIYRDNSGLALFMDNKARNPGDLVTIVLEERMQAQTEASTATRKDSGASLSAPSIAGGPVTLGGRNVLEAELSAGRSFNGSGDSAQSNRLEGNITATVVDRLPNGNLIVAGEKQIRLNQGNEIVRIQGVIRPADILPDNTVRSSRVADARITYAGRGPIAEANAMGWLTRFFQSPAMPF
ncbi:MAG: flagellar basal body L-ring protein FlgH [Lysobacteraceae bacterium]